VLNNRTWRFICASLFPLPQKKFRRPVACLLRNLTRFGSRGNLAQMAGARPRELSLNRLLIPLVAADPRLRGNERRIAGKSDFFAFDVPGEKNGHALNAVRSFGCQTSKSSWRRFKLRKGNDC
jgi:hypothetical protein